MRNKNENRIVYALLSVLFLMFFLISFYSEASFDAGDGIRHYLISRYSWNHPGLFLYNWGKPFFTLISSPFSQFGLLGINVFNILCAIFSSLICYRIAEKFNLNYSLLIIFFLCFTPLYFLTINSGLTEPFFGLILIGSIYLILEKKYLIASIIVSFLPYIRNEGYFILPLFFIVLIYRKKYYTTIWLGLGTVVYSVIGYFYYKDILWLVHQNPYDGKNRDFYGHGELFHFIKNYDLLWGNLLFILFCIGVIVILFAIFFKKLNIKYKNYIVEIVFLVLGSFAVYFVAHSLLWWKGLANSLGLLRVIAAIMPCSAIICLIGFDYVMNFIPSSQKIFKYIILSIILFFIIFNCFKQNSFPNKLSQEDELIKEAGDWFRSSPYTKQKVYYLYPYLAHVLNVDSFDPNKVTELWCLYSTIKEYGINAIPDSTMIFWDAHFGPNECRICLDTIKRDTNFILIKTFKPAQPFKVLGGYDFEVDVFMKRPTNSKLSK